MDQTRPDPQLFFACNRLACKRQKNFLFFCASKACLQMAMWLVACLVMMAQATWGPPVWHAGQYWQQWQEDGSWHPVDGWNSRGGDDPPPHCNWDQQWGQQQGWQEPSGWSAWPEQGPSNRWGRSYTRIGGPAECSGGGFASKERFPLWVDSNVSCRGFPCLEWFAR